MFCQTFLSMVCGTCVTLTLIVNVTQYHLDIELFRFSQVKIWFELKSIWKRDGYDLHNPELKPQHPFERTSSGPHETRPGSFLSLVEMTSADLRLWCLMPRTVCPPARKGLIHRLRALWVRGQSKQLLGHNSPSLAPYQHTHMCPITIYSNKTWWFHLVHRCETSMLHLSFFPNNKCKIKVKMTTRAAL